VVREKRNKWRNGTYHTDTVFLIRRAFLTDFLREMTMQKVFTRRIEQAICVGSMRVGFFVE